MALTNVELWNALRKNYPHFASITAEEPNKTFSQEKIVTLLSQPNVLNEYYKLSMTYYITELRAPRAKNIFTDKGFGISVNVPWGDYIKMISVDTISPANPMYRIKDGDASVDMQKIRSAKFKERFAKFFWDYYNFITIPDTWQTQRILNSQYGVDSYVNMTLSTLETAYIAQEYLTAKNCISTVLNSTDQPLKDTQIVTIDDMSNAGETEYTKFINTVRKTITAMCDMAPYTNAYNQFGFNDIQERGTLKLLVRAGIEDDLATIRQTNAKPQEYYGLPVDIIQVSDFGGLIPYKEQAYTTQLYPVYDKNGVQIGYAESDGASQVTVTEDKVFWKDPNADVYAILADSRCLIHGIQTPRRIEAAPHNAAGLYTTYHDTAPNQAWIWDTARNMVVFKTGGTLSLENLATNLK